MSGTSSFNPIEAAREALAGAHYSKALQILDDAEEAGESSSNLHLLRGIAFAQTGRAEAATESLQKAAKLDPTIVPLYNLAVHLANIGEKEDALNLAKRCQKLAPESTGVASLIQSIESASDEAAFSAGGTALAPTRLAKKRRYGFGRKHLFEVLAVNQRQWVAFGWVVVALAMLAALWVKVDFPLSAPTHANVKNPFLGYAPKPGLGSFAEIAFFVFSILASMIWTSVDLIDRRGRALWMIPMMLGCFLFLPFVPQMLYMAIGRRDSDV